ncbi:MAG: hypothetical protein ACRDND_03800, partial [Streptosporangiaceae bacterium]
MKRPARREMVTVAIVAVLVALGVAVVLEVQGLAGQLHTAQGQLGSARRSQNTLYRQVKALGGRPKAPPAPVGEPGPAGAAGATGPQGP